MKYIKYSFFILLLFSTSSFATRISPLETATKLQLSTHPYWLKLLHYEDGKSIVNNQEFFLSKNGKTNAKEELKETIKHFINTPDTICKYPARYKWLTGKLQFNFKKNSCKELDEFLKPNFHTLNVVFTSERYNSPASVFGHTFIMLETNSIPYAINYAAKVPDGDSGFKYAYRGITGKYTSRYRLLPYSLKEHEYRSREFRDLLNFHIDLTKDEIENIMFFLFEIQNTMQDYYFMSRNCSSELLKLLNLARENLDLTKELSSMVIPIDAVYILQKNNLVKNISNKTSKLKQFYNYIEKLDNSQRDVLFEIINHKRSIKSFDEELRLSKKSKSIIILAAISYIEILSTTSKIDDKYIYPLLKLIKLKTKYNITSNYDKVNQLKENPISNKFHKLSLGKKIISNNFNQTNIGYRHFYRHRFDLVDGVRKHGSVELFDISFRNKNDKVSLDSLTLVNLEAMPISNEFFKETTNKITIGMKRIFKDDNLYNYFNYGLGYKYKIIQNLEYNIYAKTGVYYFSTSLVLGSFDNSIEYHHQNKIISELGYTYDKFSDGSDINKLYLNNYLKLSKNSTFNILFSKNKERNSYNTIELKYNINF
jgi:hypothetical protein